MAPNVNEEHIRKIVEEVVQRVVSSSGGAPVSALGEGGVFPTIDAAVQAATRAQQQLVEIVKALAKDSTILLLDEPSLGLSPILVQEIFSIVRRLNEERSVTMMLVEQNARVALNTAHYGYVLELGRIVMADDAHKLLASEDVKEFYLGVQGETQRAQKRWKRRKTWR